MIVGVLVVAGVIMVMGAVFALVFVGMGIAFALMGVRMSVLVLVVLVALHGRPPFGCGVDVLWGA